MKGTVMLQLSRPADQSILIAKIGLDIAKIFVYARFGAGEQSLTRCDSISVAGKVRRPRWFPDGDAIPEQDRLGDSVITGKVIRFPTLHARQVFTCLVMA